MPKKYPSFFLSRDYPYYIVAPDYRQTSAGVRATHYLCHILNELGYEAYVTAAKTSPFLRTPVLDDMVRERHRQANRPGIAVYPEVVSGNPLGQEVVVRWLLNKPGHLGGEEKPASTDIVFHWDAWVLTPDIVDSRRLHLPVIDERIFHNHDNPQDLKRSGFCFYAHKYLGFGGKIDPWLDQNGTSLCHDIPRSPEDLADILRRSTVLYCYEPSAIVLEARACGCPVLYVATPYLEQFQWTALERTMMVAENRLPDTPIPQYRVSTIYNLGAEQRLREARKGLSDFIRITQKAARQNAKQSASRALSLPTGTPAAIETSRIYQRWLASRRIEASDGNILADAIAAWRNPPEFHIVVRAGENDRAALAETLDSLNYQLYNRWHIDIITNLPCPDGLDALPSVGWQQTESDTEKPTIDFLVAAGQRDWIVELPAGAILDPLCLWRVAEHAEISGTAIGAIFTDDDIYDAHGIRNAPRFKPGVNPTWLQSADLAGPLFVRRDIWRISGSAAADRRSAWFDQLLRISAAAGWHCLSHIPDVLISYPEAFPSSAEACMHALLNPQAATSGSEIIPVSQDSWRIRRQLDEYPPVSIAIISGGQLEFLQQCLESLADKTAWDDIELLLVRAESTDPDLEEWVSAYRFRSTAVRQVFLNNDANWAEACNAAIISASHEHVVLLQEDTVILDPNWLESLVGTLVQPEVAGVSPRLVRPGNGQIAYSGDILGLAGEHASPHRDEAHFAESGYLDCLQVSRDVTLLAEGCMLLRRSDYIAVNGMENEIFPQDSAHRDFSLKLLAAGKRLIYQPQSTLVHYGESLRKHFDIANIRQPETRIESDRKLAQRWLANGVADPFWNPNLSLAQKSPQAETAFHAAWQYLPTGLPRIAARPVGNAQGDYRVSGPLKALRRAGLALDCIWQQDDEREFTPYELARLAPDVLIAQNYLLDPRLAGLQAWRESGLDTFIVYALDDLFTEMPLKSSLRSGVPANARSRFKHALQYCDRLVVSTEFLAESYRHLIADIRVVPNRLESDLWLNLQSAKRRGRKPRIGWAGGTAHRGDLELIKPVIEATRDEADWVFMGMHTDEIRPLLTEFHPGVAFSEYPAKLAALDLDIAIAPLEINRFNQGKSNLRLLEYGVLGIPVVATDIDPYRNSPACILPNDTARWIEALRERIHDAEAREREGAAMKAWVMQQFILENHLDQWLTAHLPD